MVCLLAPAVNVLYLKQPNKDLLSGILSYKFLNKSKTLDNSLIVDFLNYYNFKEQLETINWSTYDCVIFDRVQFISHFVYSSNSKILDKPYQDLINNYHLHENSNIYILLDTASNILNRSNNRNSHSIYDKNYNIVIEKMFVINYLF
ncbi:MAG: hypothetical protein LBT10_06445 [Methanobrevibacter sp.]|jgi:histidinol phosphatase-like PHP family hydrolase|nr:hypothetical protein [Methanobrevibacter sp.]